MLLPFLLVLSPAHAETLTVDHLERHYLLTAPAEAKGPLPLLLVLHGSWGSAEKVQRGLGFDQLAKKRGFLAVFPDAYAPNGRLQHKRWADGRRSLVNAKIDDVKFLGAVVDDVAKKHPVDRGRVFVTGISNGAMMAYRAACEAPWVNAIAPVIGNIVTGGYKCKPPRAVSLLAINGGEDPFVPLEGGEMCKSLPKFLCEKGLLQSQAESLRLFAGKAGCGATPSTTGEKPLHKDGTSVTRSKFPGCGAGFEVEGVVVNGGGHAWPPRPSSAPHAGRSSKNFATAAEIVEFFLRQPARN